MNRSYKVIWNKSLRCFMAVSEYAKSRGKSSSSAVSASTPVSADIATRGTRLSRLSALCVGLAAAGMSMQAMAGAVDGGSVFLNCKPSNIIGSGTTANQSVAVGAYACASGDQSVAVGANTHAKGNSSVAIGGDDLDSVARGKTGTATGMTNKEFNTTEEAKEFKNLTGQYLVDVQGGKQYISTEAGNASVAVGVMSSAKGALSLAFGTRAEANVNSATALGTGATASKAGATALGAGSLTDGIASKVEKANVNGVDFVGFTGIDSFAGTASDVGRQVSVGSIGNERQIKNVAPGQLSATSTDAINGSQIYAVSSKLIDNIRGATNTAPVVYTQADGTQVYKQANGAFNTAVDGTGTAVTPADIITSIRSADGSTTTSTKLSNVAAGTIGVNSTDAVNGGQLFTTNQNVEKNSQDIISNSNNIVGNTTDITTLKGGFKLQTNGQNGAAIKAGDTVDIGVAELTDTNLTATKTGNNVAFALSKDLQLDSVTTGNTVINNAGVTITEGSKVTKVSSSGTNVTDGTNTSNYGATGLTITGGPSVTTAGINAGDKVITGVADAVDATDAVNKGQLDNLADGAVQYERDPITNAINYNKVILAGTPAVIGKDANGNNIVISGGTSLGNVANGVNASDAVNKGQLDSAQNALTNAGLSFAGDSGTNVKRKLGETLSIKGGAKAPLTTGNIGVVANGKDGLLVQLAKDIDLGADGSVKTGNTVTNNEGVKVDDGKGNSTTITTAGTNAVDDEGNSADYTATGSELADKDGNTNISTAKGNTITNGDNVTTITGKGTNVVDNATGNSADYGANGFIATDAAGNTTIFNQGGVSFIDGTGMQTGPSISVGGINAGGTVITNVGDAVKATDAVNKGQLDKVTAEANGKTDALGNSTANHLGGGATYDSNTGTVNAPTYNLDNGSVNVNNVGDALTNLDDRITSNTDNIADLAAGKAGLVQQQTPTDSITVGAATGGTSVDFTGKDGDRVLTGVANGTVAAGSNDVVTGDQLNNTADSIVGVIGGNAKNEGGVITTTDIGGTGKNTIDDAIASLKDGENASNDNIQANTDRLDAGLSFGADNGADINKPIGDGTALKFEGSDNITTTTTGSGIKFDLSGNISVDSVTTGNTTVNNNGVSIKDGPSMTVDGIYAGNKTITGVADGIEVNDAVNLGQLNALDQRVSNSVNELGYKIGEVEDGANAGISAAMAMSSLPQAYIPGKSMIGGGVATYNGQSAVAVGISRVSDNGRWVIKANGTADTQGNAGGAIGAGFHF